MSLTVSSVDGSERGFLTEDSQLPCVPAVTQLYLTINIVPVSGSRFMARLRATGADWGLDTRIIF